MHPEIADTYRIFQMYSALRGELIAALVDEDLRFSPGGANRMLGELCVEIGEIEHAYVESFKTFTQNFDYHNETPGLANSVDALRAWYEVLDAELEAALGALTEEQLTGQEIDRGDNFTLPPAIQLVIYKEALLIFYGKVSVYLKAMGRNMPGIWPSWIG
jgi:hypothetical protein